MHTKNISFCIINVLELIVELALSSRQCDQFSIKANFKNNGKKKNGQEEDSEEKDSEEKDNGEEKDSQKEDHTKEKVVLLSYRNKTSQMARFVFRAQISPLGLAGLETAKSY